MSESSACIVREFPLREMQEGAMLGNSYLGLLVWGAHQVLNLTIGCGALWDHRGGMPWTPEQNLSNIHRLLLEADASGLQKLFATTEEQFRPTLLPTGRVVIRLPEGYCLLRYRLFLKSGLLQIQYRTGGGARKTASILLDRERKGAFIVRCPDITSWELLSPHVLCRDNPNNNGFYQRGFVAPIESVSTGSAYFLQNLPADESYSVAVEYRDGFLRERFDRGKTAGEMNHLFDASSSAEYARVQRSNRLFWQKFWRDVPPISLPERPDLEQLYYEGLYKFASMTAPDGVPAGLQGPWLEDNALPLWSSDYHFNINVEMCYSPALRANHPEHLKVLFDLVFSWEKQLRWNARCFAGIDDGFMLPHAVDDRCVCMGGFWSGIIDHACSAWIAQLMYDYCDFTGDFVYLREKVYPFMRGVLRVFEKMTRRENGVLSIPLSVSPEYRGKDLNAWGENSSFLLASAHRLAENLIAGAKILQVDPDPFALEIERDLPPFATAEENGQKEIALWNGLLLEESHRHHSHLGGIVPFNTLDPADPALREILRNSFTRWVRLGMGAWSGWCMSWAAMLHMRIGMPEMAVQTIDLWRNCFTNPGGGSLHDAYVKGLTYFANRPDVMQMDGVMGMTNAIQELFLQDRRGVLFLFAGIPVRWKSAAFESMGAPGGLLVSGTLRRTSYGEFRQVEIRACRETCLRLNLEKFLHWTCGSEPLSGGVFERKMSAGDGLKLMGKSGEES